MQYLLDTDHISVLQEQSGPEYAALDPRLAQVPLRDVASFIVSFHEQFLGCNAAVPLSPRLAIRVRSRPAVAATRS